MELQPNIDWDVITTQNVFKGRYTGTILGIFFGLPVYPTVKYSWLLQINGRIQITPDFEWVYFIPQGPVVRRAICVTVTRFFSSLSKAFSCLTFCTHSRACPINKLYAKRIKLSLFFKLSYLNSHFAITQVIVSQLWTTRPGFKLEYIVIQSRWTLTNGKMTVI